MRATKYREIDAFEHNNEVFVLYENYISRYHYRYRIKNSAGQVVEMDFYMTKESDDYHHFWIFTLSVNKKSRGYEYGKETGKAGIESLILAKDIVKWVINHRIVNSDKPKTKILIFADDNRRFNAYEYGLSDMGFKKGNFTYSGYRTGNCLVLDFKKN